MCDYIRKIIKRIKWKRFCKLNGYYCPDCIYHDFVFDRNNIFRGNRCRYMHDRWGND